MYDFALDMSTGLSLFLCVLSAGLQPGGGQRLHLSEVAKCRHIPLLDQLELIEVARMAFPEAVFGACYFCSQRDAVVD